MKRIQHNLKRLQVHVHQVETDNFNTILIHFSIISLHQNN